MCPRNHCAPSKSHTLIFIALENVTISYMGMSDKFSISHKALIVEDILERCISDVCLTHKSESFRLRFVLFTTVRSADLPLFPSSPAHSNSILGQNWVRNRGTPILLAWCPKFFLRDGMAHAIIKVQSQA